MQKDTKTSFRKTLVFCFVILGLFAALVIAPYKFRSEAGKQIETGEGLNPRTHSQEEGLENYDIRADKSAHEKITKFRQSLNRDAAVIADIRDNFVRGEETLRTKVPTLKVEYNEDIRTPEVIGTDIKQGRAFLTTTASGNRAEILRGFAKANESLIGVSDAQADALRVVADYTNPDGNLSFAHLEQRINNIPVFRGEIKAGFTKNGEMIRVINNLAPGLDYESLSNDFGNPLNAVRSAAQNINYSLKAEETTRNDAASDDLKVVFGNGDWATTAEKMYFPTEPGVAVAAWRVLIWQPVNAYYVIVDARTGTMLWRKNITEDQTQAATYQVYANPNSMINVADSPAAFSPGPINPTLGTQGALTARTNVTVIGNEAPYTFNNNGWITDGANITDGNYNESGIDRVAPNGVDAPIPGVNRSFSSTWNPPPGNPAPGDAPLTTEAQKGAVIQMFYVMNRYQSEMYRLGFTEQAFNFQGDNFGRGGVAGDRVSAEGQDSSGTNNANFSTPADGGRGRMQMFIWTGPTPDYDGTADADIIIHEVTHGLSNRLHGNSSGLSTNMARGMGEGWSDFYAHAMLSEPTDPSNGVYSLGGYATYLGTAGFTGNYYYGIRRYPKAPIAFTGGANNKPHNAYIFSDINAGCATRFTNSSFAFGRGPFGASQCDAVHNAGEVWSSALWEVREKLISRLGWEVGNRKALQLVTDGMKLAPLAPTMLTERDAILAAAQASAAAPEAGADVADVWAGFALRGMGFSARVVSPSPANVTNGFDLPNLLQTPTFTVSDTPGDGDGFPEPGEPIVLTIPLTNSTGGTATGVTLEVVGGGTANYGSITNGQTVSQNINFTVPANTLCGNTVTLTLNVNSSLGATSLTKTILIGVPITTLTENFDGVTAPAFPAGWTATAVAGGTNFITTIVNPDTATNSAFALDPLTVGGGTDLTSPSIPITASAATVTFRNNYNTEAAWDGGVLEISIGAGVFQDILTAGGSFITNGYNGVLGATGVNNPLAGRNAWTGNSNGYVTTTVQLPAAAAGQNVRLRWRFGADDNTAAVGWNVDTISVIGSYACSFIPTTNVRSRADFDGDGKTDLSVFRPSEGNWYLNGSTAGFSVLNWGISSDILTPGDFDGDGKTDTAIFRATNTAGTPDFYVLNSNGFVVSGVAWGSPGDVPVVGDYDGDGNDDIAVFRPADNTWYILNSGGGATFTPFGQAGDTPLVADWDGDGKSDLSVKRGNLWIAQLSGGGTVNVGFGQAGDLVAHADYDGDSKDDIAVFRPSNGTWYLLLSSGSGNTTFVPFGQSGDIPVPGDYDGDGEDDVAVYRNGQWWISASTSGVSTANFGIATDKAIPSEYLP